MEARRRDGGGKVEVGRGMIVLRIANKSTQSVEVVATKDSLSEVQRFSLTGLTLTPQG